MVRLSQAIIGLGILLLLCLPDNRAALAGLVIAGLGCAPVYPCLIHAAPDRFGAENSQAIIGIQMASAYMGTSLMPPFFGWISAHTTILLFPIYLIILLAIMIIGHERLCQETS